MQANLQIADRADQLDRERFKEMVQSAAFARFLGRIEKELNRLRENTEAHARSIKEIRIAQGGVSALRMVLGLPDQMLKEMQTKKG